MQGLIRLVTLMCVALFTVVLYAPSAHAGPCDPTDRSSKAACESSCNSCASAFQGICKAQCANLGGSTPQPVVTPPEPTPTPTPPVTRCGKGQKEVNGKCVNVDPPSCKSWQKKVGGKCVSRCKRGETWNGRKCVPAPITCAEGEVLVDGKCVAEEEPGEVECPDKSKAPSLEECTTKFCSDGETVVLKTQECPDIDCGDGITVKDGETCPDPLLVATKKACEDTRDEVDWLKWLETGYFLLLLLLLLLLIALLIWKLNKLEKQNRELRAALGGYLPPDGGSPPDDGGSPPDDGGQPGGNPSESEEMPPAPVAEGMPPLPAETTVDPTGPTSQPAGHRKQTMLGVPGQPPGGNQGNT